MLLKLSQYNIKLEYYNFRTLNVKPMIAMQKVAIEHTLKKMKKKFKHFTAKKKSQLNTKGNSNEENERQRKP